MGGGSSFLGAANNSSIACLFNFAAAQTNPRSSLAAKTVTVPTLIIGGQNDCVAPALTNQNVMWDSTASSNKFAIILKNLTHCDFGNGTNTNCLFGQISTGCGSTVTNTLALKLYMNFLNPFLAANLKNDCVEATRFMDSVNLSQVIFSKKLLGTITCTSTKLNSFYSYDNITVYPNPSKELVYITLENTNGSELKVELINILGQVQLSEIYKNKTLVLNLSLLTANIYSLRIYKNNILIATKKIIKD
jgi:hypothetical protein